MSRPWTVTATTRNSATPRIKRCATREWRSNGSGRSEDAVRAFDQAVERFADLPELRNEVARALDDARRRVIRGVRLASDGHCSEAAEAMNEAVEIFRRVARTNSGVDNVSVFRKMYHWHVPGERIIALMTAGNLATTQAVLR